jgi:hypothetical protein
MGLAERQLDRASARDAAASAIAVRSRVIVRCAVCGDLTDNVGDVTDAYRLGNFLVTRNDPLVRPFHGDRRALTDTISRVLGETPTMCRCETEVARDGRRQERGAFLSRDAQ